MRYLFLLGGFLSMTLAIIGTIIPLLPTVPFLLLAAYFFSKSSPFYYKKLLNHSYFGKILHDYQQRKVIPIEIKLISLGVLWLFSLLAVIFLIPLFWLKILPLLVTLIVTIHVLKIRSS